MIRTGTACFAFVLTLVSLLLSGPAAAQVDPGNKILLQFGKQVGALWVPERLPEACEYQEHWYLFPDYEYPGDEHPIDTTIRPVEEQSFETLEDFLDTMNSEHPDGRHITTIAIEHRTDCP
ncbi:MAG: hypothetical protein K0U98_08765 [Deltaproteobacteria bacterium]|nr:hypothetical protein [Deltaproteobacteria bacterium]